MPYTDLYGFCVYNSMQHPKKFDYYHTVWGILDEAVLLYCFEGVRVHLLSTLDTGISIGGKTWQCSHHLVFQDMNDPCDQYLFSVLL